MKIVKVTKIRIEKIQFYDAKYVAMKQQNEDLKDLTVCNTSHPKT